MKKLFILILLISISFAENITIPKNFDAVMDRAKIYNSDGSVYNMNFNRDKYAPPKKCRVIYFRNGKFFSNCKYSVSNGLSGIKFMKHTYTIKYEGEINNNTISGKSIEKQYDWFNKMDIDINVPNVYCRYIGVNKGDITGKVIDSNTIIFNIKYKEKNYIRDNYYQDGKYIYTNKYVPLKTLSKLTKATLYLKILNKEIDHTLTKDKLIVTDPLDIAFVEANAPTKAPKKEKKVTLKAKKIDPCKDPAYLDKAMKEYCEAKEYNKKLKEQEEKEQQERLAQEEELKQQQAQEQEWQKEDIEIAQQELRADMEMLNKAKAKLKALKEYGVDSKYKKENIKRLQEAINSYKNRVQRGKAELKRLGGKEIAYKKYGLNDVIGGIKEDNSIYIEQQKRKAKQAEIAKAHKIVDTFGDDIQSQLLAHKKIDELSKNADISKAKKITKAIKTQFYDSSQERSQIEAVYQNEKVNELERKEKYVESIKDTSLALNKALAHIEPTG